MGLVKESRKVSVVRLTRIDKRLSDALRGLREVIIQASFGQSLK